MSRSNHSSRWYGGDPDKPKPPKVGFPTRRLHVPGKVRNDSRPSPHLRMPSSARLRKFLFEFEDGMYPERYEPGMEAWPVSPPLRCSFLEVMEYVRGYSVTETVLFLVLYYDMMMFPRTKRTDAMWSPYRTGYSELITMMGDRHPAYRYDGHLPAYRWLHEIMPRTLAASWAAGHDSSSREPGRLSRFPPRRAEIVPSDAPPDARLTAWHRRRSLPEPAPATRQP